MSLVPELPVHRVGGLRGAFLERGRVLAEDLRDLCEVAARPAEQRVEEDVLNSAGMLPWSTGSAVRDIVRGQATTGAWPKRGRVLGNSEANRTAVRSYRRDRC